VKFIGPMCLCKPCRNVCLHKGRDKCIDLTTFSTPFSMLMCTRCWKYRMEWNDEKEWR